MTTTVSLPTRAERMIKLAASHGWTVHTKGVEERSNSRWHTQWFEAFLRYPIKADPEWEVECKISFKRERSATDESDRWGRWSSRYPEMHGRRTVTGEDGSETVSGTSWRFWRRLGDIEFWLTRPESAADWRWLRGVPYWISALTIELDSEGWAKLIELPFSYRNRGRQVWLGRKHSGINVRLGRITRVQGRWIARLYGEDGYEGEALPESFRSKRAASKALKEASLERGRLRIIHDLCSDAITRLGNVIRHEEETE